MGEVRKVNIGLDFRERFAKAKGMDANTIMSLYTSGILDIRRMRQWLILDDIDNLLIQGHGFMDIYAMLEMKYGVSDSLIMKLHKIDRKRRVAIELQQGCI